MNNVINISNLHLGYLNRFKLHIENLSIEEGKIFSIIGPNGAGKTTLLNVIAMQEKPQRGRIEIFGQDIFKIKNKLALRRKMSFVFSQSYLLNKTVYHNVSLPLKIRGINNLSETENMLNLFRITHLRNNNAFTLSDGERRRVALARAFVTYPKLLLLDEPFLSLDKCYKESLIDDLYRIIKKNQTTVLFVTQELSEPLRMADILAVMENGAISRIYNIKSDKTADYNCQEINSQHLSPDANTVMIAD